MTNPNPDEKLLDEILADFGEAMHGDYEHVQAKYKAKKAILSEFFSKDKVREAIGEDEEEPPMKISMNDFDTLRVLLIEERNKSRASLRSKLGIEG